MSRLFIFCEGFVEQENLKGFLRPYWQQRFDDVELRRYDGAPDLKNRFKKDAEMLLSDKDWYVLCLLDLFEEPFKICKPHMSHAEQFDLVQRYMFERIDSKYHSRFAAIPVVMEIETWILADPALQRSELRTEIANPEDIEHPYVKLKGLYGGHYDKKIQGSMLFRQASAQRVFDDNCPHFRRLIEWLLNPTALVVPQEQKDHEQSIQLEYEQKAQHIQQLRNRLEHLTENDSVKELLNELIKDQQVLDAFQKQHSKVLNLKR